MLKDGAEYRRQRDGSAGHPTGELSPPPDHAGLQSPPNISKKKKTRFEPLSPTPLLTKLGPWTSPVNDVSDKDLDDWEGGPRHPLPEKQPQDSNSPVRVWTAVMPTQNYPLPTTLHGTNSADNKATVTPLLSPKRRQSSLLVECNGSTKKGALVLDHSLGTRDGHQGRHQPMSGKLSIPNTPAPPSLNDSTPNPINAPLFHHLGMMASHMTIGHFLITLNLSDYAV